MRTGSVSSPGTATVEWRAPAVRYVVDQLGVPDDRLIRVVDVRVVRPDEAWVALVVDGTQVVVGLRREACAGGGGGDGWFRLLYLDPGEVAVESPDRVPAPPTSAHTGRREDDAHG